MKRIQLDIYPRSLYLTNDAEEYKTHSINKSDVGDSGGVTGEYVDYNKNYYRGVMIYVNKETKTNQTLEGLCSTIAHEALHAVNMIFKDLDIEYNRDNDEHAAYLLGFITKECFKYNTRRK